MNFGTGSNYRVRSFATGVAWGIRTLQNLSAPPEPLRRSKRIKPSRNLRAPQPQLPSR